MKTALFIFIIGAAAGAFGFYYLQQKKASSPNSVPTTSNPAKPEATDTNTSFSDRARNDVKAAKDAVAAKFAEWHLTPEDISAELARTGQVVRTKAHSAGESIASTASNARIVTAIKAKYTLDKELSARAISVDCDNGQVALTGTVASPALIAKAVGLALDTDGVTHVKSLLTVAPPQKN
jgi:lambda repressor-like predicted transcriptional regulator